MALIRTAKSTASTPTFSKGTIYSITVPDTTNHSVVSVPTNLGDTVFLFVNCGYSSAVAAAFTAVATDCQILENDSDVLGTTQTIGYFVVQITGNSPSLDVTYSASNAGSKHVGVEYLGMTL